LTNNDTVDGEVSFHGGLVAWTGLSGSARRVFLWDGNSIQYIPGDTTIGWWTSVNQGGVCWSGRIGEGNHEIFLYNGAVVTQITHDAVSDQQPSLSNGQIAWQAVFGDQSEIMFFDGRNTQRLTTNSVRDERPCLENGSIAFVRYNGNTPNVYFWDGSSEMAVSDNGGRNPSLSNGQIAYQANDDGGRPQIFLAGRETSDKTYAITASSGSGGSMEKSGQVSVGHGASCSFAIKPDEGFEVDTVTVDGKSVGNVTDYTFEGVTENHTIHAEFVSLADYKKPRAFFSQNRGTGTGNLLTVFFDKSEGNIKKWEWDFGDGATSLEQSPTHIFENPGNFTITLKVTDHRGDTDTFIARNRIIVLSETSSKMSLWGRMRRFLRGR
jgi:plastocyanin